MLQRSATFLPLTLLALGTGSLAGACSSSDAPGADPHVTPGPGSTGDGDGGADGSRGEDGGTVDVGGRPLATARYTIGFWCGPPAGDLTAARMTEIAGAGFTHVSNPCDPSSNEPAYNTKMLDLAKAAGLQGIVTDRRVAAALGAPGAPETGTQLDAVVADYGKATNLYGYHVVDEPNVAVFPAIGQVVAGLAQRDAVHPAVVNLLPTYGTGLSGAPSYDAYVGGFLATVKPKVYSYDHYNFLLGGADTSDFFENLAVVRARSLASKTPFWQYIQSIAYVGHRATTGPEKRWAALHTLAYGGAGVFYFTYWTPPQTAEAFGEGIIGSDGKPTAQYGEVTAINETLAAMGKYLAPATSTRVFHDGALAAGTVPRRPGDPVYVPSGAPVTVGLFESGADTLAILVNRSYVATTEGDVWLASADHAPEVLDVASASFRPATIIRRDAAMGDAVRVSLGPGDAALFHLRGPVPKGAPGAELFVGTVRADSGTLNVLDRAFGGQALRASGWDECPDGYVNVGRDFQPNGFWACARADLANRKFRIGNVVADGATIYAVGGGTVTARGAARWDDCDGGTLLGHRFDSNGFWACLDP